MIDFTGYDMDLIIDRYQCAGEQLDRVEEACGDEGKMYDLACELAWAEELLFQLEMELIDEKGYEQDREYHTIKQAYGDVIIKK
jgi:hypothetical protein